jgi:predicted dehydrogenase
MQEQLPKLKIGVIGCGHWGPNHIRVFSELDRSTVVACADNRRAQLDRVLRRFPQLRTTTDHRNMLGDERIDAVVIATPTNSHGEIAREALSAGKHVLVEKPLCTSTAEVRELTALANERRCVLMVGHVFLYNGGIMRLRESIERGDLGRIHYLDAVRTNLGPIRGDVNALYDLGTHDISIFNYLLNAVPVAVSAQGSCISQTTIEDVCFATLKYPDGALAHIHVSWLNPRKVRTLTVVGEHKMAYWDDVQPEDTLRVYDKGLKEPPYYDSFGEFRCLLRNADVHLPKVDSTEPLINQANAFLDSVVDGVPCRSGGAEAEAIAAVLEAATRSLQSGGVLCPCSVPSARTTTSGWEGVVTAPKSALKHDTPMWKASRKRDADHTPAPAGHAGLRPPE